MIIRYFINGVFLFVLYILLFQNIDAKKKEIPNRSFNYLFAEGIHPDTIVRELKNEVLLVSEMETILTRIERDQLSETMNGLAIMYGVSKQAQRKINDGVRTEQLDFVIATLEKYAFIVEIPKSDWGKFTEYFQQCLFENLRCDHLVNRVTRHEYFPAALLFCMLICVATLYLLFRKRIINLFSNLFSLVQEKEPSKHLSN
ncbi:MAG: hypothetical protein AAFQ94_22645 [Bacteroidota bacterium]